MSEREVSVSEYVDAPVGRVFAAVSDPTRMGEWSPESDGATWRDGATGPARGARFTGRNRNGWRRWSTSGVVVTYAADEEFAFDVSIAGLPISRWSYRVEPSGSGTQVVETWTDRRPGPSRLWLVLGRASTGTGERSGHNREGMRETLRRLKAAMERQPGTP